MLVYRIARQFTDEERAERTTRYNPFEGEYLADDLRYGEYAGVGWWHGPHRAFGTSGKWNYSLPTPETDRPGHEIQPDEVCACESVEKLLEWFETAVPVMIAEGFRLLTIYIDYRRAVRQEHQVVFPWSAVGRIVRDEPVSVLLPLVEARRREREAWEAAGAAEHGVAVTVLT